MRTLLTLIIAVAPVHAFAAEDSPPKEQELDEAETPHIGPFQVPRFDNGGFIISFQWGGSSWWLNKQNLDMQTGGFASRLYNQLQSTPANLGLRIGYVIKGFAGLGVDFSGTGWDAFAPTRGGAGFVVGTLSVHPLQFFFINKKGRPIGVDVSMYGGAGYGIVGTSGPPALGMDGLVFEWGFNAEYYFSKNFGVGFFAKCVFLQWGTFYTDWDGAHSSPPSPGSAAALNPPAGGNWWHSGIALILRVGE